MNTTLCFLFIQTREITDHSIYVVSDSCQAYENCNEDVI